MAKVGFVGLGVMGAPMAGHLLTAGHEVTVWSRTPSKAEALGAQGASVVQDCAEMARACEIVCICVNRTEDVEEVVQSLLPGSRAGQLFVDHSTITPAGAIGLQSMLAARDIGFVDAPITGGSMGAQKGQLTIFCGGLSSDVQRALPIVQAYAKTAEHVGPPGAGQRMKLANQIAVGGALLALCESLAFAEKAGLSLEQTHRLLSGGAAGSWAFDNYGPKILANDWSPGFSIKNQRKDFGYTMEAAAEIRASVPGTELVDSLLKLLQDAGRGEETTCALFDQMVNSPGGKP